jgi:FAD/FMN-containing dehydrogenase
MQSYTARKKLLLNNLQNTEGEVYLKKKTSNLFRYQKKKSGLDVRGFNHVLNIDTETQSAEIEGMATYEDIVDATLKLGHMPTVIPELKSITVGGAITGTGLEMTSFKYGWVHETILEMDVLTPKGKIATCF